MDTEFDTDDKRWDAVLRRDSSADGAFCYSVRSTGIYCRPSCPSRHALRKNVAFHASCGEAEAAGFRPCLRCKPNGPPLAELHARTVEQACRLIEASEVELSLEQLALACGMSSFHFHRIFRRHTGITPKAYAAARRAQKLQDGLGAAPSVTDALYAAGFNSSARFYAASNAVLGMQPNAYRAGGAGATIRFAIGESSLGAVLVAATARGICAILIGDDPDQLANNLQDRFPKAELIGAEPGFESWVAQVVGMVESPGLGLDLPLDVRGTVFQQRVWQALRAIPPGQTVCYSELAARIGVAGGARAVAGACAANPVAVAIPCHRVVRNDGSLSCYRWGVERKRTLLEREAREREISLERE
ncbi:MAG TPA: bifunctional DNA-binding transcriptional regulator/O6-methylguanine-DNA methyltransferase Ada [Telluria sp.]